MKKVNHLSVVPKKTGAALDKILDQCGDRVDLGNSFRVKWSKQGVGMGMVDFVVDKMGRVTIDGDHSKEFLKDIMNQIIDDAYEI